MKHHDDAGNPAPPVLRVTNRAQGGLRPEGVDAPFASDRLTALTHELGNLLDGSMRCLVLARRALGDPVAEHDEHEMEVARQRMDTVLFSMQRMVELVRAASSSSVSVIGFPGLIEAERVTLLDVVTHAIDVLAPQAEEARIELTMDVAEAAGRTLAGPMYSVVFNALTNAIEAIGGRGDGHVRVEVFGLPEGEADPCRITRVVVRIVDDGPGLPEGVSIERAFDHGFSTRAGSSGIGLALIRSIMDQLDGEVTLVPLADRGLALEAQYTPVRDVSRARIG